MVVNRKNSGGGGSSGEEDGDANWRAAIDSVASVITALASTSNGSTTKSTGRTMRHDEEDELTNHNSQNIKHYQIKAQNLLVDIIEKTLEIVRNPAEMLDDEPTTNEGGVRLFEHAPPGIVFDHIDELQGPTKKPRILPGKEIDENSKKFRRQLQSVAVDGVDIIAAAKDAHDKSLAKLEAKYAAAKAAAKREEERIAELKKVRGERWLPSVARHMRVKFQG
ncbi:uncharacterized protein LOC127804718 isoform X2 [Diospyros lotus]|nr:uncharacterized protein LOC127804718 isoform X2 [Diospyros lotus]